MAMTDKNLTVRESLELLALNGIDWTEVWMRIQIGSGKIRSFKEKHMRLIPREEVMRIVKEHKTSRAAA